MNVLALMMSAALIVTQPVMTVDVNGVADRSEGTIYVGDSRFNGMEMHLKKGDGYIVAKDSMGYKWFVNEALPTIDVIKNSHPEIEEWTLVSGLGVNDLYNINNYIQAYKNLSECGYRVVVVSVNPTNRNRSALNTDIDEFNQALSNSGLEYLDLCNHLRSIGFDTVDGLHYRKETYKEIWNEINWYLVHSTQEDEEVYSDWMCLE